MRKSDTSWHELAVKYYLEGHTMQETLQFLKPTCKGSDRGLRKLLRERGINRGVSGAQRLKRFACECKLCKQPFQGRTPTVIMCDGCVGDDSIGVTKQRLKRYGQYRKIASYGLDIETYEKMLSDQAGLCGLCQRKMKQPCIDHDHVTGRIRGMLCHQCNLLLGQVELSGNVDWLKRAESWIMGGT